VAFGYAKATEGTGVSDDQFAANWQGMQAAGVMRGAYHFFHPGEDAAAQASFFLQTIGTLGAGDLPPMLDVEANDSVDAATIAAAVGVWISAVQAATGMMPIIYTYKSFWETDVGGSSAYSSYPFWIADYTYDETTCPNIPAEWSSWIIYQYSDMGSIAGISGGVDRDAFNGTLAQLQAIAGGNGAGGSGGSGGSSSGGSSSGGGTQSGTWGAKFVSQSFPYASQPAVQMNAGDTLAAYIELKNTGTTTWDSNTRLGTTQPRDRQSALAGPDWVSPSRPSAVSGTVPPGGTYKFQFTFQAPATPGDFTEYFGVVEDGATPVWFGDAGEGGPPDDQLEALIHVNPAPGAGGSGGGSSAGGSGPGGSSAGGSGPGGSSSGGSSSTGGFSPFGGSSSTGGSNSAGGSDSAGGSNAGGGSSVGGSNSAGGSNNGGSSSVGGGNSAGGSTSAGGSSSAGGSNNAGGVGVGGKGVGATSGSGASSGSGGSSSQGGASSATPVVVDKGSTGSSGGCAVEGRGRPAGSFAAFLAALAAVGAGRRRRRR
jgi:lysozyme